MTQQHLVMVLHSPDLSRVDWILLSDTGTIDQTHMNVDIHTVTETAKNLNVTVTIIVPPEDALLSHVTLPKLNRQQLQQALPYALEEELIDDVNNYHFAVADRQPDGTIPVAIVSKNKMHQWLEILKSAHIDASVIIPYTLALPLNEIFMFDDVNVIRTGIYSGWIADKDILQQMIALKKAEDPSFTVEDKIHPYDQHVIEKIARDISKHPYINLLQGTYPAKRKSIHTKNVWRLAAYLAGAWIGAVLFSSIISFFILQHQSHRLDQQITQIYTKHFPQASNMVAPRERMETKLKEVITAAQKNNFLSLLATVSKALSQSKGIRLQNLDYRNGQLTLAISSANFENVDLFTRNLTQQGLTVKQQNAATAGAQVKATLLINAGAS